MMEYAYVHIHYFLLWLTSSPVRDSFVFLSVYITQIEPNV